jgi:hypothetical protein
MKDSKIPAVANFIGMMFVLVGLYASVRTIINFTTFNKYPTNGVLAVNLFGMPFYGGPNEADCEIMPLDPYSYPARLGPDGEVSSVSAKTIETQTETQKKSCIAMAMRSREEARASDVNTSAFFLFIGLGVLGSSRVFLKKK